MTTPEETKQDKKCLTERKDCVPWMVFDDGEMKGSSNFLLLASNGMDGRL